MKIMLTNASKKSILMMSLLASMAVLISCGGDDPAPDPDSDPATVNAGFTSEVDLDDSFTYTFTNTTVILGIDDLTGTFAWDFGGDGTSTEKGMMLLASCSDLGRIWVFTTTMEASPLKM